LEELVLRVGGFVVLGGWMGALTIVSSFSSFLASGVDAARAALYESTDIVAPDDARKLQPTLLAKAAIIWPAPTSASPDGAMSNSRGR
jgi:hypothetical protein